jgi:hypothetical protein
LHNLDENPHSLRRYSKQAAKKQSKGEEPKKIACKMLGICTVTHLWIGIWRGMERNQKWEESRFYHKSGVDLQGGGEPNPYHTTPKPADSSYGRGDPCAAKHRRGHLP